MIIVEHSLIQLTRTLAELEGREILVTTAGPRERFIVRFLDGRHEGEEYGW